MKEIRKTIDDVLEEINEDALNDLKKRIDDLGDTDDSQKNFLKKIMELEMKHKDDSEWEKNFPEEYKKLLDEEITKTKER